MTIMKILRLITLTSLLTAFVPISANHLMIPATHVMLPANHSMNFDYRSAVLYAIHHSPTLTTASTDTKITTLEYNNAIAEFFPKLDVETTQGTGHGETSAYSTGDESPRSKPAPCHGREFSS